MADIYQESLKQLDDREISTVLSSFGVDVAWEIGTLARKKALEEYPLKAIVIDISLPSGQVLFHTATKSDATIDNDEWVARKKRTAFRFGKSSFYVGQKLRQKNKTIEEAMFVSSKDYATHGGSVPIRVKNVGSVVAALTISGLAQEEDHLFAIDILSKVASKD